MESVGYHYARRSQWPDAWQATVAEAASAFDAAILGDKQKLLERINTNRLQLKFPRTLSALPAPIRACVEELEARMRALCGDEAAGLVLSGRSEDGLVEVIELPGHPWFLASQFHPEFTSNPRQGHPLFSSFVAAARECQGLKLPRAAGA